LDAGSFSSQTRVVRGTEYLSSNAHKLVFRSHQTGSQSESQRVKSGNGEIPATPADIAIANRLVSEALGRSLDELRPETRRMLLLIDEMVTAQCQQPKVERADFRFSRQDVRLVSIAI
jgi:hypothetical protein